MRRVGDDRWFPGPQAPPAPVPPRPAGRGPPPRCRAKGRPAAMVQHPARRFSPCRPARQKPSAQPNRRSKITSSMLLSLSAQSIAAASSGAASVARAGYAPVNTRPAPCSRPKREIRAVIPCRFHLAPHLSQNFQHRRIERRARSRSVPPGRPPPHSRRPAWKQKCGRAGAKNSTRKAPAAPRCGSCELPAPSHAAAAPVQESGKVGDLRLPGRPPQDGPAPGTGSGQQKCLGGPHAGETQGDLGPVQAGGSRQHQPPFPSFQLHASPSAPAPPDAGQWAGPRCGSPPGSTVWPGPAVPAAARRTGWRPAFVPLFAPARCCWQARPESTTSLPSHRAEQPTPRKSAMQCSTSRKAGHSLKPHLSRAEQRCRTKAAERCFSPPEFLRVPFSGRPPVTTIFRSCHVRAPIPQKIPHRMQNRAGV